VAQELSYGLFAWSITEGLVDTADGTIRQGQDPQEMLLKVLELPENTIVLLRDFHLFMETPTGSVRTLKMYCGSARPKGRPWWCWPAGRCFRGTGAGFRGSGVRLPAGLNSACIGQHCRISPQAKPKGEKREHLLDSACGLTSTGRRTPTRCRSLKAANCARQWRTGKGTGRSKRMDCWRFTP